MGFLMSHLRFGQSKRTIFRPKYIGVKYFRRFNNSNIISGKSATSLIGQSATYQFGQSITLEFGQNMISRF